jgi:hypothetical protein
VYQPRPLVFSLGLNNPPRRYFIGTLKVARQKDMTLQTGGLSMLNGESWNSVSCQVPRSNLCRGLWQSATFGTRIAKNRITVARIATDRSMNLRADCHRQCCRSGMFYPGSRIRPLLHPGFRSRIRGVKNTGSRIRPSRDTIPLSKVQVETINE